LPELGARLIIQRAVEDEFDAMRESHEDWLALGRDLIARGLGAALLIVADGAPGLIKAIEQCWAARVARVTSGTGLSRSTGRRPGGAWHPLRRKHAPYDVHDVPEAVNKPS
jgi:hypothetical protein